jgi:transposase
VAAPPFAPNQAKTVIDTIENSQPIEHGLPGRLWTLKKLKQWAAKTLGITASRNAIRRVLKSADLTWKKIKKLLGKAKPEKRAEHVKRSLGLFEEVRDREITLMYVDESHFHRDMDY